jgi:hypothetical protein
MISQDAIFQHVGSDLWYLLTHTPRNETWLSYLERQTASHAHNAILWQQTEPLHTRQAQLQPRHALHTQVFAVGGTWSPRPQPFLQTAEQAVPTTTRVSLSQAAQPRPHTQQEWLHYAVWLLQERNRRTTLQQPRPKGPNVPEAANAWAFATVFAQQLTLSTP